MLKATALIVLLTSILGLQGCVVVREQPKQTQQTQPQKANPLQGKTMSEILTRHQKGTTTAPKSEYRKKTQPQRNAITNYTNYTRTEQRELNGLFPRLHNPDLCMYVYPHLSTEGGTIPGYTSCTPLFKTNQYAMPGES